MAVGAGAERVPCGLGRWERGGQARAAGSGLNAWGARRFARRMPGAAQAGDHLGEGLLGQPKPQLSKGRGGRSQDLAWAWRGGGHGR